ncbi:hypothetical protein [Pandoraea apista]|uniref:hypothetical protein n=1 Tax=Pandoraea apista TaxID=93218 RepID=UPI002F93FFD0
MPDLNTVTFDAELMRRAFNIAMNADWHEESPTTFVMRSVWETAWRAAMLAAAPTPAAQSAGQEAVAEAWNSWPNHDFETCCKYEPQALIAAPVNGGDNVDEIALRSRWNRIANSEDMFEQFVTEVRALLACAAPVNGGERDDARRMRTLCRLLDAADDLGNGFPGEVHHAFQEGAKVVRNTLDRFALPEDGEQLHASDCAVHNMPAYPNGTCNCERAADAPQVGGGLTKEEIDFVLAVFGNPDAKRAYAGDYFPAERPPVWEEPELLGLIVATGSYKWRPTEKLRGIMRAALSSPAKVGGDERDHIALAKAMLVLVDEYHDRPSSDTRTALRVALTDEFSRLLARAALSADGNELELHRADYAAIKAAGFQDPGELLDAYLKLSADGGERKDAERYRFLRECGFGMPKQLDALDAAIDTAIAAKAKGDA